MMKEVTSHESRVTSHESQSANIVAAFDWSHAHATPIIAADLLTVVSHAQMYVVLSCTHTYQALTPLVTRTYTSFDSDWN